MVNRRQDFFQGNFRNREICLSKKVKVLKAFLQGKQDR